MKKVFVVILNWNGKKDTIDCLETIQNMEHGTWNMEVIVVDNGSTDGSIETIKKFQASSSNKTMRLIENKKNLGFAEGNNVGISYALKNGADYVIILNNDTLVDKNLVAELVKVMESDKTIGVAGPKIYFAPGYEYHKDRYQKNERGKVIWYAGGKIDWQNVYAFHRGVDEVDHGQYEKEEETDFATGCAMIIRREVLEKVGLLDSKYFLYWEDTDLCERVKKRGFKIFYVSCAFLWHKNASSSDKPGSNLHQYYQTRNRLLFGIKYAPLRTKLALLRESLMFVLKGGVRSKAVVDFYLGRFGGKDNL